MRYGPAIIAKLSDSSQFARTTQNLRQELFLSKCIEERADADAAETLPLNMYRRELTVGDRVRSVEPSSADDQLSEYDSDSSDSEESSADREDADEGVLVNFLSRTIRTRTGRPITLSYRALSLY